MELESPASDPALAGTALMPARPRAAAKRTNEQHTTHPSQEQVLFGHITSFLRTSPNHVGVLVLRAQTFDRPGHSRQRRSCYRVREGRSTLISSRSGTLINRCRVLTDQYLALTDWCTALLHSRAALMAAPNLRLHPFASKSDRNGSAGVASAPRASQSRVDEAKPTWVQ